MTRKFKVRVYVHTDRTIKVFCWQIYSKNTKRMGEVVEISTWGTSRCFDVRLERESRKEAIEDAKGQALYASRRRKNKVPAKRCGAKYVR